jgi:hypothetical protein
MNTTTPKPATNSPRVRFKEALPDWAKWAIPLGLACLTFAMVSPGDPHYRGLYQPAQPVQVSPYTRSDGTPVSGYSRAEPGERATANAMNRPIITNNRLMTKEHKDGVVLAVCAAVLVFAISRAFLTLD